VPRRFGIHQSVGDTAMPGGISRALRQIPPLVEIAHDVAALAPDALFVNYANPMAPICLAIERATDADVLGLCSGLSATEAHVASLLGRDRESLQFRAAGINHLTWIVEARDGGRDVFPEIGTAIAARDDIRSADPFSWELFRAHRAIPAPLDRHVTEFYPGVGAAGGYFGRTLGVDAFSFEETIAWGDRIHEEMRAQAEGHMPLDTEIGGGEPVEAIAIARALWGDAAPVAASMNLQNSGQVPQLSAGAIVETTAAADASGLHPVASPDLPEPVAEVLRRHVESHVLTITAALNGDRDAFVEALLVDGNVTDHASAKVLADELIAAQRDHLPQFG
jgi:alpha-galactosidase